MKILLEGPDGSGKTTLAKILCEAFKMEYLHFKHESDDNYYLGLIYSTEDYIKESTHNILVDRYIPSEIVYGNVLRSKSRIGIKDKEVSNMVKMFDRIIFCLPSDKDLYLRTFKDCLKSREEMVKDVKLMEDILSRYQDLYISLKNEYKEHKDKFLIYDYQKTYIRK